MDKPKFVKFQGVVCMVLDWREAMCYIRTPNGDKWMSHKNNAALVVIDE